MTKKDEPEPLMSSEDFFETMKRLEVVAKQDLPKQEKIDAMIKIMQEGLEKSTTKH